MVMENRVWANIEPPATSASASNFVFMIVPPPAYLCSRCWPECKCFSMCVLRLRRSSWMVRAHRRRWFAADGRGEEIFSFPIHDGWCFVRRFLRSLRQILSETEFLTGMHGFSQISWLDLMLLLLAVAAICYGLA